MKKISFDSKQKYFQFYKEYERIERKKLIDEVQELCGEYLNNKDIDILKRKNAMLYEKMIEIQKDESESFEFIAKSIVLSRIAARSFITSKNPSILKCAKEYLKEKILFTSIAGKHFIKEHKLTYTKNIKPYLPFAKEDNSGKYLIVYQSKWGGMYKNHIKDNLFKFLDMYTKQVQNSKFIVLWHCNDKDDFNIFLECQENFEKTYPLSNIEFYHLDDVETLKLK